jgi:RNA polymerase subunit RPABC4/transcription elongation factor Spt4
VNKTLCSHCGEKILPHWTLCPVCALPFADAVSIRNGESGTLHANGRKEIRCVQCEQILAPDAQMCGHCHVLIIRRYCSGCSRLIPDQTMSCPYCATPATAKRSRYKFFLQSAAAVILLGSIVGGLLFLVYRVPANHQAGEVAPLPVRQTVPFEKPAPAPFLSVQKPVVEESTEVSDEPPMGVNADPQEELESEPVQEMAIDPEPAPIEPIVPSDTHQSGEERGWETRGAKLQQGRKLTQIASRLMQQGRYSDAIRVLRDAVKSFPPGTKDLSYGEALYKLGICLRRQGRPDQAIPVLQQAMKFPYIRGKVVREVQVATTQLHQVKLSKPRN